MSESISLPEMALLDVEGSEGKGSADISEAFFDTTASRCYQVYFTDEILFWLCLLYAVAANIRG